MDFFFFFLSAKIDHTLCIELVFFFFYFFIFQFLDYYMMIFKISKYIEISIEGSWIIDW